jgi:hypothetical protein
LNSVPVPFHTVVVLLDRFNDLKDDDEREEVLAALRERAGRKKTRSLAKWDWAQFPCITGVDCVTEEGDGLIILAKRSIEQKNSKSKLFFLAWYRLDQVHEENWPIFYEHIKTLKNRYEELEKTRFYESYKNFISIKISKGPSVKGFGERGL